MGREKLICPVCGKPFYKGQGVIIDFSGRVLIFHSKNCAIKFIRSFITYVDPSEVRKATNETLKEFSERLEALKKIREKKLT
ncbi:MAG: hypothetical protein DRO15_01130 [Thermoprotei archaeon]|nr:MAG: hypothetical protein DRO15_01130 [Thermoprotei archaeon]